MYSKTLLALAAAAGAVQASPLIARQASSAVSAVESAAASGASSAVSAVTSAPAAATSAVSSVASDASSSVVSATSAVSSGVSSAVSGASSMVSGAATTTGMNMTGQENFPRYPCPTGTLLTYVQVNQSFVFPVTQVTAAFGEWATSPLFPNVTNSTGGDTVGATHTININAANISLNEVLVSRTSNDTSGYEQYTWNSTDSVTAMGITLANYSTVLQIYDPDYPTTQMIGNSSIVVLFTNACLSSQAEGMTLLSTLGNLELQNLVSAVAGNVTSSSTTAAAGAMSTAASTASMVSSMASSAATSASSMASSAASGASSAASSAASGASSAALSATSVVGSAVSAAVSAVSSTA